MICKRRSIRYSVAVTLGVFGCAGLIPANVSLAQDIPTATHSTRMALGTTLSLPSDVGIGKGGRIYVVDGGNHQLAVFDALGVRVGTIGEQGSEAGQFESPVGLGISREGEVHVADKGNQRLQVFSANGRFLREIALEENGEKVDPVDVDVDVDVAVSADGKELYVSANNSHRILVFSSEGNLLRAWGGEGEEPGMFRYPATIGLDPDGNILIVDVLNQRVQKFDSDGYLLLSFGELGGRPGTFFRPKGIAVDSVGRSYVSDSYLGAIQVFDVFGEFLYVLGAGGKTTVFKTPVGLAADGSRLFVVQMLAGNVLALDIEPPVGPQP